MVDINCALLVGGFSVVFVAMGYGYKIHFDRKSIKLEKNDKQHEQKHHHNEERIKELEKKNGHEQRQIDEHKAEITELKKDKGELKDMIIKLQNRIINCEKITHNTPKEAPNKGNIPMPPPPPPAKEAKEQPKPQEQEQPKPISKQQKHNDALKEALEKRRKKIEGEDEND